MCVLPYLRHLVPEKKKSFTFSHFPFRTSTDHCCSRKRSPLTCYYCTCLLYNKFMYACILFTFSRRHARVYCLSVKRGAFISCEQLLLLLFDFFFSVFHKACGTIDLQALLRKGARLFPLYWECAFYTTLILYSFFGFFVVFFFEFRRQKPLGRIQCICTYMASCQLLFHLSRQIEKKKKNIISLTFSCGRKP